MGFAPLNPSYGLKQLIQPDTVGPRTAINAIGFEDGATVRVVQRHLASLEARFHKQTFSKSAWAGEIIEIEPAILEFALDQTTARECRAGEDAVDKASRQKVGTIEQRPIPLDFSELATDQRFLETACLKTKVFEITVA